ncbi:MAG: glutathione peroxidase [Pseudomonadota bacterium]|nr:glutathione peroxidase [Pseudomonadota bacterium]
MSVFDLDSVDIHGNPSPLGRFRGQPMLVVNTASLCGFSSQFKGLEAIWQNNKDKGLIVLAVPSNDFGHQEPGNNAVIVGLCTRKFGITFPVLAKSPVTGPKAHPLFKWLSEEGGFLARPRWNFYKYLIAPDGQLKHWFSPLTSPDAPRFQRAIKGLMAGL